MNKLSHTFLGATDHAVPRSSAATSAPNRGNHSPVAPAVAAEVSPASVAAVTCPDCDGPFSYRIVDEDTRCSYPVDDGEHYCEACDALFTDDFLNGDEPEDVRTQFAKIFGTPEGWSRIEL